MRYDYKTKEMHCKNNGQDIYGLAYIPEGGTDFPLVIFAHQLGATHAAGEGYAAALAALGTAVYIFDFCGGGVDSHSNGEITEMSILTEAEDLEAVLETARSWEFVDERKIVLLGASQGGVASAITAARHREEVAGLILLYPAFMIFDRIHAQFGALENVPEKFRFLDWVDVGRRYAADIWDVAVYDTIRAYDGPVLLIHGGKDTIADLSYSERAAQVYADARLCVIGRAGHIFYGRSFRDSVSLIADHLRDLGLLQKEAGGPQQADDRLRRRKSQPHAGHAPAKGQ